MDRIGHAGLSVCDDDIAGGGVGSSPVVLDRQRDVVARSAAGTKRSRCRGLLGELEWSRIIGSRRHAPGLDRRAVVCARLARRAVEEHSLPIDPGGQTRRRPRLEPDGVRHRRRALLAAIGHRRHGKDLVFARLQFGNRRERVALALRRNRDAVDEQGDGRLRWEPGQVPVSVFCQDQTSPSRRSSTIGEEEV